jgi:uncharacterized protein RhaS with RHS repeats
LWTDTDLASVTTPAGVVNSAELSENRSVLTKTLASGNVVTVTYAPFPAEYRRNPFERAVLQVSDSLGLQQSRTYSATGRLESIFNGEGDSRTFVFAPNGDLAVTDAAGVVTTYSNRGDHGSYMAKTRGSVTINSTFDLVGNLLTVDGLLDQDSRSFTSSSESREES